jgi:hypothetical protein
MAADAAGKIIYCQAAGKLPEMVEGHVAEGEGQGLFQLGEDAQIGFKDPMVPVETDAGGQCRYLVPLPLDFEEFPEGHGIHAESAVADGDGLPPFFVNLDRMISEGAQDPDHGGKVADFHFKFFEYLKILPVPVGNAGGFGFECQPGAPVLSKAQEGVSLQKAVFGVLEPDIPLEDPPPERPPIASMRLRISLPAASSVPR